MVLRADVVAAAHRIDGRVHRTPVLSSRTLDAMLGVELRFKCENFQRVGAFKMRGATNAVRSLPRDVEVVATHSSGNHGAALALAAAEAGLRAIIVVPRDARESKRASIERYGAEVVDCEPTLAGRESTLEAVCRRTGATFVPPYDDERIIAGAGTAALEFLEDCPELDQVWVPVGVAASLPVRRSPRMVLHRSCLPSPNWPAMRSTRWRPASSTMHCRQERSPTGCEPRWADGTSRFSATGESGCALHRRTPSGSGRAESPRS